MSEKQQNNKQLGLIDWLASLRLTVFTLIFLGLAVLAGTVIPQLDVVLSRSTLPERLTDPTWRTLYRFGLLDVFHSVWFLFLVGLLATNLAACTIRSIGRTRRLLARVSPLLDESSAQFTAKFAANAQSAVAVEKRLAAIGRLTRTERDGETHWFAQNSPWLRYGSVVAHCSLLFVLAGAIARAFLGVEGQIILPEGGSASLFMSKNDELIRLPFEVRCEKFTIETYPGTQRPKDFRSELTIWRDGRRIAAQTIQVNRPLSAGPYRFFQANYGQDDFPVLRIVGAGLDVALPVGWQQVQSIPGRRDGLLIDEARPVNNSVEIHLILTVEGQAHEAWLRERGPAAQLGSYAVSFTETKHGYYTGLLATADPGVRLLYAGFGVFFVGLFATMYTAHRRAWARLAGGEMTVAIGASRHREAAKAWLNATVDAAKG